MANLKVGESWGQARNLPWPSGERPGFGTQGPGFDPQSRWAWLARHIFQHSTGLFTIGTSISELSP